MSDNKTNNGYSGEDYHRHHENGPGRRFPWPLKVMGAILFIPAFLFLGSWVLTLIWNAVLPGLFGLPIVTLWQAMGIMVIGRLIFGGRRGGPGGFPRRPRFRDKEAWRSHLRGRFADGGGRPGFRGGRPLGDMPDAETEE